MEKKFEIISNQYGNFLINENDLIGNNIKQRGVWEPWLVDFYSNILTKDNIAIDVGANLGFHSIQFGKKCKKVLSFEPQPLIYNQLCANILFNDLDDIIKPYRVGLGEKPDIKQMWDIKHEDFGSTYNYGGRGIEHEEASYKPSEFRECDQIEITSLDLIDIPHCELIKIDIQGYEYYFFQGAKNFIEKNKPVILLENSLENKLDKEILNLLKEKEYKCYRFYHNNNEDCILIHHNDKKYNLCIDIIKQIQIKYNLKQDF
jgi:FkbM family methyltransferase